METDTRLVALPHITAQQRQTLIAALHAEHNRGPQSWANEITALAHALELHNDAVPVRTDVASAEIHGCRVTLYVEPNHGELRLDTRIPDNTNSILSERTYEVDDDGSLVEL